MRRAFQAITCALMMILCGCTHYGYADKQAPADAERREPIAVFTVATPADEGLDAARLTRALAGTFRRHGVDARWQPTARMRSARCSVARSEVRGLDETLFASAEVRCEVGRSGEAPEQFSASGRYVATGLGAAFELVEAHADLQQAAAIDALEKVAAQIARRHVQ